MKHAVAMMKQLRLAADDLGKTIILVIHDINFASTYSDYILAMKKGALCYQGGPKEIMRADVLQDIFDTPVRIREIDGQLIAMYFR